MPAGALGFGGGLARGLANVFGQKRLTDRADAARKEDQDFKADQMILPHLLKHGEETGDYSRAESIIYRWNPELEKQFKKEGSPFQVLGPLLSKASSMESVGAPPDGTTAPDLEQEPKAPLVPTRIAGVPPAPPSTFLGMPVLSREQRLERGDEESDPAVRMRLALRYSKTANVPLDEAMDRFGLREFAGSGAQGIRFGGTVSGADLPESVTDTFGRPIDKNEFYRVENLPNGTKQYSPTTPVGRTSGGAGLEGAAQLLGYTRLSDVPPEKMPEVEAKAKEMAEALRYSGGIGAGKASVETDKARLLTPTEATELQSKYGITRGQAAELGRIPLTPPQVASASESYLLEADAAKAEKLFTKVWPRDESPEARRLALMQMQREQNPDFVELMSVLKRMPLRLAVMTQGSRPSDDDRKVFDMAFPTTASDNWSLVQVPSTYESGAQLLKSATGLAKTSRESIGVIPLSERNAPNPPKGAPGAGFSVIYQGKTYSFDSQAKLDLFKRQFSIP